ncbi:MAG: hypothetical protein PHC28_16505 [Flavobacterium sp.]|uniref:hypothetical protein n=1 Tax=Flavobacterium sp. TaxID=239 RepID=UPI002632600F|nr:hypothetical protein [Flavobacterium sp.]MDD5152054.1 hypothetical protein [Flavobacterium sp.]
MKNIKLGIIILTLIMGVNSKSFAQQEKTISNDKTRVSLEIDPATFAFNGYSAHLRIQPKNCDHLLFGVGIYAMDMPSVLVNFNKKNKDKGWDVRLNNGVGLFGEHHFTEVNRKWFVGAQMSIQEYKIENETFAGSEKYTNILAMGYFGYTIKPFKNNLYIKPWAGIGYTSKISGNNTLGSLEYDIAPITMFATLHIGYTFN